MKYILFISIFCVMFSCFAITELDWNIYAMSSDEAVNYIAEHSSQEDLVSLKDYIDVANIMVYLSETSERKFTDLIVKYGLEKTIQTLYFLSFSNNSKFKSESLALLDSEIYIGSDVEKSDYFRYFIVAARGQYITPYREKIIKMYSKNQIRRFAYEALVKYINIALEKNEYYNEAMYYLEVCTVSYAERYLDGDEKMVKAELKELNEKAYPLFKIQEYKKTLITLRKLYKSLDL